MIGAGSRTIKIINDVSYLYYMYNDYNGKRITKYCGREGTAEANIVSLKTELDNLIEIQHHLAERIQDVQAKYRKIKNNL